MVSTAFYDLCLCVSKLVPAVYCLCTGIFVPSTEHRKVKSLLLAKNSTKLTLKNPGIAVCELFSAKLFKEKLKTMKQCSYLVFEVKARKLLFEIFCAARVHVLLHPY
ncbi:conserved hypothetical protein [Trichinella spiralis]|uniref:hypothetical protein n=1 Tax=Trichinella spiralis TaxID=6334 RepID=UPI0001EFCA4E|nr:conserved hypothetical protein [Trichinella spiralis]